MTGAEFDKFINLTDKITADLVSTITSTRKKKVLWQLFVRWDFNGNGLIEFDELEVVLNTAKDPVPPARVRVEAGVPPALTLEKFQTWILTDVIKDTSNEKYFNTVVGQFLHRIETIRRNGAAEREQRRAAGAMGSPDASPNIVGSGRVGGDPSRDTKVPRQKLIPNPPPPAAEVADLEGRTSSEENARQWRFGPSPTGVGRSRRELTTSPRSQTQVLNTSGYSNSPSPSPPASPTARIQQPPVSTPPPADTRDPTSQPPPVHSRVSQHIASSQALRNEAPPTSGSEKLGAPITPGSGIGGQATTQPTKSTPRLSSAPPQSSVTISATGGDTQTDTAEWEMNTSFPPPPVTATTGNPRNNVHGITTTPTIHNTKNPPKENRDSTAQRLTYSPGGSGTLPPPARSAVGVGVGGNYGSFSSMDEPVRDSAADRLRAKKSPNKSPLPGVGSPSYGSSGSYGPGPLSLNDGRPTDMYSAVADAGREQDWAINRDLRFSQHGSSGWGYDIDGSHMQDQIDKDATAQRERDRKREKRQERSRRTENAMKAQACLQNGIKEEYGSATNRNWRWEDEDLDKTELHRQDNWGKNRKKQHQVTVNVLRSVEAGWGFREKNETPSRGATNTSDVKPWEDNKGSSPTQQTRSPRSPYEKIVQNGGSPTRQKPSPPSARPTQQQLQFSSPPKHRPSPPTNANAHNSNDWMITPDDLPSGSGTQPRKALAQSTPSPPREETRERPRDTYAVDRNLAYVSTRSYNSGQTEKETAELEVLHALDGIRKGDVQQFLELPENCVSLCDTILAPVCILLRLFDKVPVPTPPGYYWDLIRERLLEDDQGLLDRIRALVPADIDYDQLLATKNFYMHPDFNASYVLPKSTLLAAMCFWCKAVIHLCCVMNNWVWPPNANAYVVKPTSTAAPAAPTSERPYLEALLRV
eukprot:TRINITY_DN63176_c0_g1_i1.p1 TRINITY_DN63176_c0_g1~~TRINITY_DN63176_c0_g1_i1.p1  ORF type:complete len:1061 (+),score=76.00 TRINITY_DN63176_c0_g1_i1:407-3184(+)